MKGLEPEWSILNYNANLYDVNFRPTGLSRMSSVR